VNFTFNKLNFPEVILVTPQAFGDDRGFFMETYEMDKFFKGGINRIFVQDNHSKSSKGVLRGLHFQKHPKPQGKLVRCIQGEIFDVAVDIRRDSPTYKNWAGVYLSQENKQMLWIPEGFAHGFLSLTDNVEICYKCTDYYDKNLDAGIMWNDPQLNIDWGIKDPILSEKDKEQPLLRDLER